MAVPQLKANYMFRDSWTRLNVTPARIMQVCVCTHIIFICPCTFHAHTYTQQEKVIAEVKSHSNGSCDSQTVHFLEALNLIFESGLLSKDLLVMIHFHL